MRAVPANTPVPMVSTASDILTVVKAEQPLKRLAGISVIPLGIVISFRLVQPEKIPAPSVMALDGMLTVVSDEQPENTLPRCVTPATSQEARASREASEEQS